ncbi:MAG: Nif3-like dinuclear metal center hexameric protein [Candidatus Neomarinimicrobiota bacterium]|jgi:dinuclear metal center YbgI/SA1388 family protein
MIKRDDLARDLEQFFRYEDYEDYCLNGLQVEGKNEINKIAFAVSYNLPSLQEAINSGADAFIVHHGIFGKNFFSIKGREKTKIKALLDNDISLFGIHLPLDAHRELGNNAQLAACISAEIIDAFSVGYSVKNTAKYSIEKILKIYHEKLGTDKTAPIKSKGISPARTFGMDHCNFGPDIPENIAIVSGGGAGYYEKAIDMGVDTYITGDIREQDPAIAFESKSNFINLGHYYSETLGIKALENHCKNNYNIETIFINVKNRI